MSCGRILSLLLAVIAGIGIALLLYPRWRDARDLDALLSQDQVIREQAWDRLVPDEGPRPLPAQRLLDEINEQLTHAPDQVFLHAADALRRGGLWGREHQPMEHLLREARLRAETEDPPQEMLAVDLMRSVPLDTAADRVMPIFNTLLRSAGSEVRRGAFEAAAAWAGPQRVHHLDELVIEATDDELLTLRQCAREVAALLGTPPVSPNLPDAPEEAPSHPRSAEGLNDRADAAGSSIADPSASLFDRLLDKPAAATDGTVYASVLLAERRLSRSEAVELTEHWLRSFDDGEKRAGALLAALTDSHAELLRDAYELENVGSVRTIQRLALWASGNPVGREDPLEFAHRALHLENGDFNPDTVLAMLTAGQIGAIELLVTLPPDITTPPAESIQTRLSLIDRFLPGWCTIARFTAEPAVSYEPLFQRLEAIWMLTRRRLAFDASRKVFHLDPQQVPAHSAAE